MSHVRLDRPTSEFLWKLPQLVVQKRDEHMEVPTETVCTPAQRRVLDSLGQLDPDRIPIDFKTVTSMHVSCVAEYRIFGLEKDW